MYSKDFEDAWNRYPRKIGKPLAFKKYNLALKVTDHATIITGIIKYSAYTESVDKQFIKHFSTFLNQQCYLDEFDPDQAGKPATGSSPDAGKSQARISMDAAVKAAKKGFQKLRQEDEHPEDNFWLPITTGNDQ